MTRLAAKPLKVVRIPTVVANSNGKAKWEYKQIIRNMSNDSIPGEDELNKLGKDGWEFAGILKHSPFAYLYFKRVKN